MAGTDESQGPRWLRKIWNRLPVAYGRLRSLSWPWYAVLGIALPSGFLFGLGAGFYLLFTRVLLDNPEVAAGDPYKDVLQTVLAIAAIAISAFGIGVYAILSRTIESRVRGAIEFQYRIATAKGHLNLGMLCWQLYEHHSDDQADRAKIYLEDAIIQAQIAYTDQVSRLDENDRVAQSLLCKLRNNWAYFISEKAVKYDADEYEKIAALAFVTYLKERIGRFPEDDATFQHTIETVRERLA